jgi:hypothetical protein
MSKFKAKADRIFHAIDADRDAWDACTSLDMAINAGETVPDNKLDRLTRVAHKARRRLAKTMPATRKGAIALFVHLVGDLDEASVPGQDGMRALRNAARVLKHDETVRP